MTQAKNDRPKISPVPRAILAGLIAGIAAGYIAYLFVGLLGLIIGFIAGLVVGSRTVLLMAKSREETP
jgi:multisubunit Na+/H+ antiporter MnhB subunit